MSLEDVVWTIEGQQIRIGGWSYTSHDRGGPARMSGQCAERDYRSLRYRGEAVEIIGRTVSNREVWAGRLAADPQITGGLALLEAEGLQEDLRRTVQRRLFQTRDVAGLFHPREHPPTSSTIVGDAANLSMDPGALRWIINAGASSNQLNSGAVAWVPGALITRVAFDWLIRSASASYLIDVWRTTGPGDSGWVQESSTALAAATGTLDDTWTTPQNQILVALVWTGAATTLSSNGILARNLRVNGIATGDEYAGSQVVSYLLAQQGVDASRVESIGSNLLPLDWADGNDGGCIDYVADLEDAAWRRDTEGGIYVPYSGAEVWTVAQEMGATPDLVPLGRKNRVVVRYTDVGGAPREVTVDFTPDPPLPTGVIRAEHVELQDVQADSVFPTTVANTLASKFAARRYGGRIVIARCWDSRGIERSPLELQPGTLIRIRDWGPGESLTLRVREVAVTQKQVIAGIDAPATVSGLITSAGLAHMRSPSTAELSPPEPGEEPASAPALGHVHHEERHRHVKHGGHIHHGKRHQHL